MSHRVLDLYAGSGVGVALKNLGVEELGVEIMPEAIETRRINGMETVYDDAWESWRAAEWEWDTLWASPPCQAFSVAGKGVGRKALDDVLSGITTKRYESVVVLRDWASQFDDERVAHVLIPLHYAHRYRPPYIALEQVPPVLPVWEAYAEVLKEWGYSVVTGILKAEQYGVPQTRRRAILIARADGVEARMPEPTHSEYYPRSPEKLDAGVKPWVSMAEALDWGMTERPYPTVAGGDRARGGALGGTGAWDALRREQREGRWTDVERPSPTVTGGGLPQEGLSLSAPADAEPSPTRVLVSNYGTGGNAQNRGERSMNEPAPTMTGKADRNKWKEFA